MAAATLARWLRSSVFAGALGAAAVLPAVEPYQPAIVDPMTEPWRWRTFPEMNGLGLQCMEEGGDGTLWFGTNEGLWSYDGFKWRSWSREERVYGGIHSIRRGMGNTVYTANRWLISRYRDGHWDYLFIASDSRFGQIRQLLVARDHSLWAATEWGALRLQEGATTLYTSPEIAAQVRTAGHFPNVTIVEFPPDLMIHPRPKGRVTRRYDLQAICEDTVGRIWFGTTEGEILYLAPTAAHGEPAEAGDAFPAWRVFNEADGIDAGRRPTLLATRSGNVWLTYGTGSGYASIFNGDTWRSIHLADFGVPADVTQLIETRDGVVWLSGRYTVSALRPDGWQSYRRPEVPIPSASNFLLQTSDGALWIGGPNTEILRVDYQTDRWLGLRDLIFQAETKAGAQWFLHRNGRAVTRQGGHWLSYGPEDQMIDAPVALIATREGEIWTAGSHEGEAATARFDGERWQRTVHENFSWGIDWRGVTESSDGSVWLSANVDTRGPSHHRAGILQYRSGRWIHHHQPGRGREADDDDPSVLLPATQHPEPIGKFGALAEAPHGQIWAGRNILVYWDQQRWHIFVPPPDLRIGLIETMLTADNRVLWTGTRQFGALSYDGTVWRRHQGEGSLVANTVRALAQTSDGTIWAATDRNISRYDGHSWTANVLPDAYNVPNEGGSLRAAPSGALWINRFAPEWTRRAWPRSDPVDPAAGEFWTARYIFRGAPPETRIAAAPREVEHRAVLSVLWSGQAPWREPGTERLEFSFRLNGQAWSPFSPEPGRTFHGLDSGPHRLEVRARDRDFNVDPSPAVLEFRVLPPVWQQMWFVLLMTGAAALIATQSARVYLERNRLRRANSNLAAEVSERQRTEAALRELNAELDQRVQVRTAELQAMNQELEAFSYSVSHDLRAPLRSIAGFSEALLQDYSSQLDEEGRHFLARVRAGAQHMGRLIDDMLSLARVTRGEMHMSSVDLSRLARAIIEQLTNAEPSRAVDTVIAPGLRVEGDTRFLRIALENLIGNAWKFTAKRAPARIEFGVIQRDGRRTFFITDNGAGFDMTYAGRLFEPFRRLHDAREFPGTGIGLAIVNRIIRRHGGRIWAEAKPEQGATFFFELPPPSST